MNDHQLKLWKGMVDIIENYSTGESKDFFQMVGSLEGALDASEISDNSLVNKWYDYWTPLEIQRAVNSVDIDKLQVALNLKLMREFLLNVLNNHEIYS